MILLAQASASAVETKFAVALLVVCRRTDLLNRKSDFVPTSTKGTCGTWCCTSGNHLHVIFSNETRLTTEKVSKTQCACEYAKGRNREYPS